MSTVDTDQTEEPVADSAKTAEEEATKWLTRIETREKYFKDGWWKHAEKADQIYSLEKDSDNANVNPYNILYSNTEVLRPSLYSATPKPDVRSRYPGLDTSPLPMVLDRYLTIVSDPSNPGIESLDDAMNESVLSGLTTGLGYCRLRYYPDRAFPLAIESGHFQSLIWGKARKWSQIPWLAFRHEMSKDEFFKQFEIPEDQKDQWCPPPDRDPDNKEVYGTVVYEVWDKVNKKIFFICSDWQPKLVEEVEDHMQLEGFYPTPGFLTFTAKPGKLEPEPLYQYYRNQAEELNRVTVRLNRVLSAIKVRGAYHGLLGDDLKELLTADDSENAMIAAKQAGFLANAGGFDKVLWFMPLEKLITVATQLYAARQAIKEVIYELTGISDIIRGSNVASETATASDLKNKWGTIRLRLMQTTVANYVRDLYRLAVDAGTTCVPAEKWKEITQVEFPTNAEKVAGQEQIAYWQQQMAMMPPAPQALGGPQMAGQPPQSPPPPPNVQMAMENQKKPTIEEILSRVKPDANRAYTVNVQTSSTIDLDTASDKAEVKEFMDGMGQLLAGLQPLQAMGPSGVEASKQILVAVVQRFKFGQNIIGAIQAIQPPGPPGEDPAVKAKAEAEMAALELEYKVAQADAEVKMQEAQLRKQEIAMKAQTLAMEQDLARQKIAAQAAELRNSVAMSDLKLQATRDTIAAKAKAQKETANAPVSN